MPERYRIQEIAKITTRLTDEMRSLTIEMGKLVKPTRPAIQWARWPKSAWDEEMLEYDEKYCDIMNRYNDLKRRMQEVFYIPKLEEVEDTKTCSLCMTTPKDWNGGDRQCAFKMQPAAAGSLMNNTILEMTFHGDNWMCATAVKLRRVILDHFDGRNEKKIAVNRTEGEEWYAIVDLGHCMGMVEWDPESDDPVPEAPTCMYVGWYKGRGSVSQILLMFNDQPPRPATEGEILKVIELLEKFNG